MGNLPGLVIGRSNGPSHSSDGPHPQLESASQLVLLNSPINSTVDSRSVSSFGCHLATLPPANQVTDKVAAATNAASWMLTPWCAAYRSLRPRKIVTAVCTVGSCKRSPTGGEKQMSKQTNKKHDNWWKRCRIQPKKHVVPKKWLPQPFLLGAFWVQILWVFGSFPGWIEWSFSPPHAPVGSDVLRLHPFQCTSWSWSNQWFLSWLSNK